MYPSFYLCLLLQSIMLQFDDQLLWQVTPVMFHIVKQYVVNQNNKLNNGVLNHFEDQVDGVMPLWYLSISFKKTHLIPI